MHAAARGVDELQRCLCDNSSARTVLADEFVAHPSKNGTEKLTMRQINAVVAEGDHRVSKKFQAFRKRSGWLLTPIDRTEQQKYKITGPICADLSYKLRLPSDFAGAPGSLVGYGFLRGLACRP